MFRAEQRILELFYYYVIERRSVKKEVEIQESIQELLILGINSIERGLTPIIFDIVMDSHKNSTIKQLDRSANAESTIFNLEIVSKLLKAYHQGHLDEVLEIYEKFCELPMKDIYYSGLENFFSRYSNNSDA